MKRITTTLLALGLICTAAHAQSTWFDIGVNFSYGPTALLNSNLLNDSDFDYKINSGQRFGVKLGINNGKYSGFHILYNFANSNQEFTFRSDLVVGDQPVAYNWRNHDLMLLYRYSGRGAYIELGPKYSIVSAATQDFANQTDIDISGALRDNISGVFGFGSYLAGSDVVTLSLGMRIHYAFTDWVADDGRGARVPETASVTYPEYAKTTELSAQFNIELTYAFGKLAKTTCTGRNKLILFGR